AGTRETGEEDREEGDRDRIDRAGQDVGQHIWHDVGQVGARQGGSVEEEGRYRQVTHLPHVSRSEMDRRHAYRDPPAWRDARGLRRERFGLPGASRRLFPASFVSIEP